MEEEEEMWFNEEDDFTEEIDTYNNVIKCRYSKTKFYFLLQLCN